MKTNIRTSALRHALRGIALLIASVLLCTSAEPPPVAPAAPPARPVRSPADRKAAREALMAELLERDANAKVVLRAVSTVGGAPVAMLDVNDEPKLVTIFSELVGLVVEIDVPQAQVTVQTRDGSLRVFTLTGPRPVKFPGVTSQPELQEKMMRTPTYIRLRTQGVPDELVFNWGVLNREAKEAILLHYLQRGLVVSISGNGETSIAQLFERQMEQRSQERMQAFLATLTPEQHALFMGSSQGLVRTGTPPEAQGSLAAKNQQAKANQEELIASLTPEQRKLYDAIRSRP